MVEVRALRDIPAYGGTAGQVVLVPTRVLRELVRIGAVDTSPRAVAHARASEIPSELE